jgi:hypothetical protein
MPLTVGSRRQVWNGTAKHTSGGLTKSDLMMSHGRIVSKKKHFTAKKEMRLLKHGYGTKKGKFGYVKVGTKKHRKGHKKMRGGSLSPANVNDSYMIQDVVPQTFSPLDRALVGGRSRSRGMAGGSGMKAMSEFGPANWSGDGSNDVQMEAGMSGGRHRGRRHRGRRSRSRRMAGGTTNIRSQLMPGELNSVDVQMRAGLGN